MPAYLLLFVTLALGWVLVLRPQQRRIRAHQALVASIAAGDEIVTNGGIYGTVTDVVGEIVHLEITPGTTVRVARGAVAALVTDADRAAHDVVAEAGE